MFKVKCKSFHKQKIPLPLSATDVATEDVADVPEAAGDADAVLGADADDVADVVSDVPDVDIGAADFTDVVFDVDMLVVWMGVSEYDFLVFCLPCISC